MTVYAGRVLLLLFLMGLPAFVPYHAGAQARPAADSAAVPVARAYFAAYNAHDVKMETVTALGPWVSVRERARWTNASGPRSQAAMSVYEVRDGLLRRVWYYPEVR